MDELQKKLILIYTTILSISVFIEFWLLFFKNFNKKTISFFLLLIICLILFGPLWLAIMIFYWLSGLFINQADFITLQLFINIPNYIALYSVAQSIFISKSKKWGNIWRIMLSQ